MENVFQTIYIFLWIWYVNVCFFKYNRRMQEIELEIVGLRRIVYAFTNDKTKTNMNEKKQYSLITKRNQNKNNEIDEKMMKLKKGVFFLKKHMDELTQRVELLEHENDDENEDYASSVGCPDDSSTSDGSDN